MSKTNINLMLGDAVEALKDGEIYILAHGVNCSNGFGSGIAKAITNAFKDVKTHYHLKYNNPGWKLNDIQGIDVPNGKIYNCATQIYYGRDKNKVYADIDAVRHAYVESYKMARTFNVNIGFPLIGAGLGGLDKADVVDVLQSVFAIDKYNFDKDVNLYVLEEDMYNYLRDKL